MSEISKDLQDQLRGGFDPLLRRFLEKKPGYDGPTLTEADEDKIKAQERAEERMKEIEARLRFEEKIR